jgi:hypothetical protein
MGRTAGNPSLLFRHSVGKTIGTLPQPSRILGRLTRAGGRRESDYGERMVEVDSRSTAWVSCHGN